MCLKHKQDMKNNKDNLERITKKLVDNKAGIEHLADKLIDIKLEDEENIEVSDETISDSLKQIEKKSKKIYQEIKDDDMFNDIMDRIRGLRVDKDSEIQLYQKLEYDVPSLDNMKNNVRVKIPDKEKDDNLSDIDANAEKDTDTNERLKIKVEAQMRYDRMEKNKLRKQKKGTRKY